MTQEQKWMQYLNEKGLVIDQLRKDLESKQSEVDLLREENKRLITGILNARDAFLAAKGWDYHEVYHQLYLIASPGCDKTEPWEEFERIAALNPPTE